VSVHNVTLGYPPHVDLNVTDGPYNVTGEARDGLYNVTRALDGGLYSVTPLRLDAARLRTLLLPTAARIQSERGAYPELLPIAELPYLERHLSGEVTLALQCVSLGRAHFGALDVDSRFEELIPLIADAALRLGGPSLLEALWFTTGSTAGRGKAIISPRQPVHDWAMRTVIESLRADVLHALGSTAKIETFPRCGGGGFLRVLGRKRPTSSSTIEEAFLLRPPGGPHGALVNTIPAQSLVALAHSIGEPPPRATKRAEKLREKPWAWKDCEGTSGIFERLRVLAREAYRLWGVSGRTNYETWLREIQAKSPDLKRFSPTNGDRRHPIARELRELRAWRYAEKGRPWTPMKLEAGGLPDDIRVAYIALCAFVYCHGLAASSFGIDFERAATWCGLAHKMTAKRLFARMAKAGLLLIVDPGAPRERGLVGLSGEYALRVDGESIEDAEKRIYANERLTSKQQNRSMAQTKRTRRFSRGELSSKTT
jgi:hypothetical protein